MTRKTPDQLRSARWFAPDDFRSFGHRSRVMQMGYAAADYAGKPVIAIVNTWSDANQCHAHFKTRVDDVKRGVLQAGGFPLELPAISLSESMVKPTTMLYRNFLAMECEELLRSHPVDGAVLLGGCDKTTPGLLMGAFSMGLPCIYLPAGPMLRGNWRGHTLGSGSDAFKYWDERRAGRLSDEAWVEMEGGIARMRHVENVPVGAGQKVEFRPGSLHLMLVGLKRPLKDGEQVAVKLRFEKAGELPVNFVVDNQRVQQPAAAADPQAGHKQH